MAMTWSETDSGDRQVFNWRCEDRGPHAGPLAGLTLAVKDLFDVAGVPTGAGNPTWRATHPVPAATAPVVERLTAAGARLVGKTQTDELAYSLNGSNQHYGTPDNPAAPGRLTGGSSSGSAAAVAAGLADIGLGTDTAGSIRVPASFCGLVGIRTTHGALSRDGVVPLAPSFDCVGWLCRDVKTAARVARVLLPAATAAPPTRAVVFVPEDPAGAAVWDTRCERWFEDVAPLFADVDRVTLDAAWLAALSEAMRTLQGAEIWQVHGAWLRAHRPDIAPDIKARLDWCRSLTAADRDRAAAAAEGLSADLAGWLGGPDRIALLPTTPGAAPWRRTPPEALATYRNVLLGLTAPAGLMGWPQVTVPLLADDGAPWGLSLLADGGLDLALLDWAERLTAG